MGMVSSVTMRESSYASTMDMIRSFARHVYWGDPKSDVCDLSLLWTGDSFDLLKTARRIQGTLGLGPCMLLYVPNAQQIRDAHVTRCRSTKIYL